MSAVAGVCLGHALRSQLLAPAGACASSILVLVLVPAYPVTQSMLQIPPPSRRFFEISRSQGVASFSS